jgi:tRNA nucleotidyltransferase (CCA-adding enzyme)
MTLPVSPQTPLAHPLDAPDWERLLFDQAGQSRVVFRRDVEKMAAMGLAHLPVEAIAVDSDTALGQWPQEDLTNRMDISHRLTRFFSSHFVAVLYELQSILNKAGLKAYVIGGIVRDLLLSEERKLVLKDVDITVEGDALAVSEIIVSHSRNFHVEERFPEFGTAILHYKDSLYIDVASTRREQYATCGALPQVFERGVPLAEDVVRRDFTVNALALSIHDLGKVLDLTGGIQDIHQRSIQVLHPVSFFEDPSRILRALKFCARLDFDLEPGTRQLLEQFLRYGAAVYKGGGERIKQEFKEFLQTPASPAKVRWLAYAHQVGLIRLVAMSLPADELAATHPAGATEAYWAHCSARYQQIESALILPEPEEEGEAPAEEGVTVSSWTWEVYLCLLWQQIPAEWSEKAQSRLGLTKGERETVTAFLHLQASRGLESAALETAVEAYRFFHPLPEAAVWAALICLPDEGRFRTLLETWATYRRKLAPTRVSLDGNDLIDLGVPGGIQVGTTLRQLLYAKLSGQVQTRLDEVRFVRHLMGDTPESAGEPPAAPSPDRPMAPRSPFDALTYDPQVFEE